MMKLMLTSFGIGGHDYTRRGANIFRRMPPVSFRLINEAFMPDYELFILADQIVMDGASFEQLTESPSRAYFGVADTFRALKSDGRIELVDFSTILHENFELLEKMLDHDMTVLDQWVVPLKVSLASWQQFSKMAMQILGEEHMQLVTMHTPDQPLGFYDAHQEMENLVRYSMHDACGELCYLSHMVTEALRSAEKRKHKEYRSALRDVIRDYLRYVNANLVLANELQVPFHDWLDFTPFYNAKFLSVGKSQDESQEGRKQVERLFTVAFPELAIHDTSALLKALNDKRIQNLRQLISEAVVGNVEFDEQFAKAVLSEVLKSERRVTHFRNVLGYLTLPIGFIPMVGTPLQKAVEEVVSFPVSRKLERKHQWFYMLSEIAETDIDGRTKGE